MLLTKKVDDAQVRVIHFAEQRDLPANLKAAGTLATNHAAKVRIRPHIEAGRERIKNPEFYINGQTADLKKVSGKTGFDNGFKTSGKQGCTVAVFRLEFSDAGKTIGDLSRIFHPDRAENQQPAINEFYVIWGERSVKITRDDVLSGRHKVLVEKLKD